LRVGGSSGFSGDVSGDVSGDGLGVFSIKKKLSDGCK